MPNWCENELRITGPIADRRQFVNTAGEEFQLNTFIPLPKELLEIHTGGATLEDGRKVSRWKEIGGKNVEVYEMSLKEKYGHSDWYEWSLDNWGTKWDLSEVWIHNHTRSVVYGFNTALAPPIKGILAISRQYPKLRFALKYWECGMGYQGRMEMQNGEILGQWEGKYQGNRGG